MKNLLDIDAFETRFLRNLILLSYKIRYDIGYLITSRKENLITCSKQHEFKIKNNLFPRRWEFVSFPRINFQSNIDDISIEIHIHLPVWGFLHSYITQD